MDIYSGATEMIAKGIQQLAFVKYWYDEIYYKYLPSSLFPM